MNAASATRARDAVRRRGHVISVRRMTATLPQAIAARADVTAIVSGYAPTELVNGVTSGTRRVIVSMLDLEAAGFPLPLLKGDRIYLGASFNYATTIQAVDADHREFTGCYDVTTNGA